MKLSSYLSHSRHGIYYFRWPLPKLDGQARRSVRLSLQTRCPKHAGDIALYLASCGKEVRGNKALAGLRQDQIREKVQAYFKAQLDQYLDWLDKRSLSKNALADAREEMLDHESFIDIDSAHQLWLPVQRFKNKMDVSDAEWDASQPRIATELRKGRRDMLRRVLEAAERLDRYSYPDGAEPHVLSSVPALPTSSPLGQAIDDFIAEQSRTWTTRTTKQFKAYLNILTEFFGRERLLATITKQDANDVKKLLLNLPSSRNTIPALKGLPLLEVVKVTGRKTIAPKTINSHIQMFHSFFKWAERHGHSPHTLFEGMKVTKAKNADTEVKPYTPEQTRLIYTELTENTSGLIRSESHKWASLIGMFTGARQNEICQLHISDIQKENDIWFLASTEKIAGEVANSISGTMRLMRIALQVLRCENRT
jgi:integrase